MALEIKNIQTNKQKYIFGEDREIQISFDLESNDKDYNLNGVYINYGIEIYQNGKKITDKIEKIQISHHGNINYGNSQNFSSLIPIKIPNKEISKYDFTEIEIKNLIEIVADIKLNPFDCKKKYYPDITINTNYGNNIFQIKEEEEEKNKEKIKTEIESLKIITDKLNYNRIEDEISNLSQFDITKKLTRKEVLNLRKQIIKLIDEQKNYFVINDQSKYDELLLELKKKSSNASKKYDPNYILLNSGFFYPGSDYVSKDFYDYIIQNYKLFKISRFFTHINTFITATLLLGIIFYFYSKSPFDDSFFIPLVMTFMLTYFLIINGYKKLILHKISNDIIYIHLEKKQHITQKLHDKTLKFNDIIKDIFINYNGAYICNFYCNLECILRVKKTQGSGKNSRVVEYNKEIYNLKLAQYKGNNLKFENITTYDISNNLEKLFIQPGFLAKLGFRSGASIEIIYKINYSLVSPDLIDRYGEIIIS